MSAPAASREPASVHHLPNALPEHPDNPGIPFDAEPVAGVRVNLSAVERRAATLPGRRSVKKQWQAAWLVRAIECIDLTTLSGDDTEGRVRRLCAKARHPLRDDINEALGLGGRGLTVGAVCVYHRFVAAAKAELEGSGIPVAAVSTGFPAGLSPLETRLREVEASVADGADEIDIVITREHVLRGDWKALYDEVRAFKDACGPAHMKTILGTGDLKTLRNVGKRVDGGDDGRLRLHQDLDRQGGGQRHDPVALVMLRAIRAYREMTGHIVGFKPAGGISTAKDVMTCSS